MQDSGFKIDTTEYKRKFELAKEHLRADYFWPDLLDFARKSLNRCVQNEGVRDYQLIKRNQGIQYANRINYIASIHWDHGDRLNVSGGVHWLNVAGVWYKASEWNLPAGVWAIYQQLLAERNRRMETSKADFIQRRAQARFIYKKSWTQVGESLGMEIRAGDNVQKSLTRRVPAKEPPRGYAQKRGGQTTISIVIYNPFSETETAYHTPVAASILSQALEAQRKPFNDAVERKLKRALFAIFKKYGG